MQTGGRRLGVEEGGGGGAVCGKRMNPPAVTTLSLSLHTQTHTHTNSLHSPCNAAAAARAPERSM